MSVSFSQFSAGLSFFSSESDAVAKQNQQLIQIMPGSSIFITTIQPGFHILHHSSILPSQPHCLCTPLATNPLRPALNRGRENLPHSDKCGSLDIPASTC